MNKYPYIVRTKDPVVIIDEEHYDEMESICKLNKKEIEKLATEQFKKYLNDVGVDIKIKYNIDNKLLYHDLVQVQYQYNECVRSSNDSFSISTMKDIVDAIIKDVNTRVKPFRNDIIKEIENNLTKKQIKTKFWLNLCLISNLVWAATLLSMIILLSIK